jgi:hypothetical protein
VFLSGSSVTRRPPWLLAGSLGSVSLLSGATMKTLRLPLSVSTTSLRLAIDTFSCLARSLTPAAKSHSGVPGCCSCQCPPLLWPLPKRRQEALSSFQGTLSHICPALRPRPDHRVRLLTLWCCSRRHNDESSSNHQSFEAQSHGFCTRCIRLRPPSLTTLQCSLPGGCHLSRADSPVPLGSCKEFPLLVIPSFPSFLDLS